MKPAYLFYTLMILFTFSVLSCKKESSSTGTKVEYRISPMNNYFTSISYKSTNGNMVTINDPSQFTDGSKTVSIEKPFDAIMQTQIYNTSTTTIQYNLYILVDGQLKQSVSALAPPSAMNNSSITYKVE